MSSERIAIVGLGYVGLPLAVAFSKNFSVIGYDHDRYRIKELNNGFDRTLEVENKSDLDSVKFTNQLSQLKSCNVFIITVPTPINRFKEPDLSLLEKACQSVGSVLAKGAVIIFESTVYPGCTRDFCVPILERCSNLKLGIGFSVGFSPERINPGDKKHTLKNITKIISSSDNDGLMRIRKIYSKIIDAPIHEANSLEIAEAAKIIENTQRDLNIALMNEFSIILKRMNINSKEVIEAASTKWNFHNYSPGFVGGHCIGVDPYYLTYKAKDLGINPKVILSGRNMNDGMAKIVGKYFLKIIKQKKLRTDKILILGATFKENCPDIRNSKVLDLINFFNSRGIKPYLHDPFVDKRPWKNYKYFFKTCIKANERFDAIFLSVPHSKLIKNNKLVFQSNLSDHGIILDLKSALKESECIFRW